MVTEPVVANANDKQSQREETVFHESNRRLNAIALWRRYMNATEKNIVVAHGEAIAAGLLASAALQTALLVIPNRDEILVSINAYIDQTLNMSGPGSGDAHDEVFTLMRETARIQAMQHLDGIRRALHDRK